MLESGWFTPSLLVLPLQALAAAASVRIFAARIAPNIQRLHKPAGTIDSLGPFALALPLIATGWRAEWDAQGATWIPVGAPVVIAILAMGVALLAAGIRVGSTRATAAPIDVPGRLQVPLPHAVTWSAVGGLLLLLGAAHDLTMWVGQSAFAAGAVLLWMNTPELPRDEPDAVDAQVGGGLTLMLVCSIVQAVALGFVPMRYLPIAAAVAIAHAGMIVALAARLVDSSAAIRVGGWTAAYGILLGLGTISLRHLLPAALTMSRGDRDLPPVARGPRLRRLRTGGGAPAAVWRRGSDPRSRQPRAKPAHRPRRVAHLCGGAVGRMAAGVDLINRDSPRSASAVAPECPSPMDGAVEWPHE